MDRARVLSCIEEIQENFPVEFLEHMRMNRVGYHNLDELLTRAVSTFSPVFLPIFERHDDIYAVHLRLETPWQDCTWVQLPHDAAEPILVATGLQYLPASLLVPPHLTPSRIEASWSPLQKLVDNIPGAALPEKEPFLRNRAGRAFLRSRTDPSDTAAKIAFAISGIKSDEQALHYAEAALDELPYDPFALLVVAAMRSQLGRPDPVAPALEVLGQEMSWGFRYVNDWFVAESGPDVLELARSIAEPGIDEGGPLGPLKSASFRHENTAIELRGIAGALHVLGDEKSALAQLRNGAVVAGVHGKLDVGWCEALAEQAERVEAGCLAASLSRLAADFVQPVP